MLIEIFYPRVCGFCGRKIDSGNICARCKSSIAYKGFIHVPFNQTMHFDELYCNYDYDGLVRKKMLEYKFNHKKYLCKTFAESMIQRLKAAELQFDLIVAVPVSRARKMERGYNQSELIAKIVSKEMNVEFSSRALIKRKNNLRQSKLNKTQRLNNVKDAFEVCKHAGLTGKTILLVDDIYTTGATVNECAKILKEAGAKKIIVYTIAKATIKSHID